MWRKLQILKFLYEVLRSFGNGRLQSLWKASGGLFGCSAYIHPHHWKWGPRH